MDTIHTTLCDLWSKIFCYIYYIVILLILKYVCNVNYYNDKYNKFTININIEYNIFKFNINFNIDNQKLFLFIHNSTLYLYKKKQYYYLKKKNTIPEFNYKTLIPNNLLICYYNINSSMDCLKTLFGYQSLCYGRVEHDRVYRPGIIIQTQYPDIHQKGYLHCTSIKPCIYKSNDYYISLAIKLYLNIHIDIELKIWIDIIKYIKKEDLKNQFNLPNNENLSLCYEFMDDEQIGTNVYNDCSSLIVGIVR